MSAQPKLNEPSMEEILASIRKIIADDQAVAVKMEPAAPSPSAPQPAPQPAPPAAPAQPHSAPPPSAMVADVPAAPVLDLAVEATPLDKPGQSQDDIDLLFDEIVEIEPAVAEPEAPLAPPPLSRLESPVADRLAADVSDTLAPGTSGLMSSEASLSIAGAFANLSNTLLTHNARTLEDLVRDMLRPMLKSWLDDNLPVLVERLVRAEIERVTRGPR